MYLFFVLIIKESIPYSAPVKHGKPPRYFQDLQNSRTFQDSKKIQDFFRMWQPCVLEEQK